MTKIDTIQGDWGLHNTRTGIDTIQRQGLGFTLREQGLELTLRGREQGLG